MPIIGLTGGSGTGKSTAAALFAQKGAHIVDADAIYRRLCHTNVPMLHMLQRAFGDILNEDGSLNRPALARIVFSNPGKLKQLGEITTPFIDAAAKQEFEARAQAPLILYDAPTLFETGGDRLCESTVGVIAPYEIRLERIISRDGLTPETARARLDAQPDDAFYKTRCTHILENCGDLPELDARVTKLYTKLTGGNDL